ncbi:unnamed protein product [Haemonchus placei]|uniref:Transposase n=1 Tax=Haemonchus placei TaxID=6290 RepID=A0A0N4VVQ6_HAEPC|nr:unnamed protein product [Haemonchus placei]
MTVSDELNINMAESVDTLRPAQQTQYCGPYKLEKTLGKGQTGISDFIADVLHFFVGHSFSLPYAW